MIEISFHAGVATVMFTWILVRGAVCLKKKAVNWKQEALQLFFLVNLLVIYRMTFHPFAKVDGKVQPLVFEAAAAWPFRVNWLPFVNLLDYDTRSDLLLNLIGNTAMFIPTGIMTPLIYKSRNTLPKVLLVGGGISLAIELLQLPFAVRASDVDDLLLNTAGCLIGYGIYAFARFVKRLKAK